MLKTTKSICWTGAVLALFALLFSGIARADSQDQTVDPTAGWTPAPLNFKVQVPYNLNKSDRYSFADDIYHLWVFSDDMSIGKNNKTLPRSEMRFDPDYTSGAHQFEADVGVPAGTNRVCIMQIHTGDSDESDSGATVLMLWVVDGSLRFYDKNILLPDIYGHAFHLNVIHDLNTHLIDVFINNKLACETKDYHGDKPDADDFYFKCGVYSQKGASPEMQVYFKNIRLWKK
jgi:Alginate lyase